MVMFATNTMYVENGINVCLSRFLKTVYMKNWNWEMEVESKTKYNFKIIVTF